LNKEFQMKLVIFGASGRTGRHLIEQALELGHDVTAVARTPDKIATRNDRLKIVAGNIHDMKSVEQAVQGQDVVLCALGRNQGEAVTTLADGTKNILQAMQKHEVRRMINVSAAGFMGERADFLVGKILLWYFNRYLRKLFETMKLQHEAIVQSDVEWIAVRPFLLDEGPRKGNYRIAVEGIPSKGYRINTGDVAEFMLKHLTGDEYLRQSPAISY